MSMPIDTTLHRIADVYREQIMPVLDDGFAIETARLGGMLLTLSANAVDDAAALRVDENADMRALFAQARDVVADAALAASLAEATESRDPGLRVSELDAENDRLRRLLVSTHAQVELQDDDAARETARQIWRMLAAFETRRAPRLQVASAGASAS
jgi:hypothetical protein